MSKIIKPAAPEILVTKGKKQAATHSHSYNRSSQLQTGQKQFDFKKEIYQHRTVKETLAKAQHGKCCYCESKIIHISHGDIEHFRPKSETRQSKKHPAQKPGYYWLVYDWDNLFLSCSQCNGEKSTFFPLRNPRIRARCHRDEIAKEKLLLIHPSQDDPNDHLFFNREEIKSRDRKGEITLSTLDLNRIALLEKRREAYKYLLLIIKALKTPSGKESSFTELEHQELQEWLINQVKENSEYTSMKRALLQKEGFYEP